MNTFFWGSTICMVLPFQLANFFAYVGTRWWSIVGIIVLCYRAGIVVVVLVFSKRCKTSDKIRSFLSTDTKGSFWNIFPPFCFKNLEVRTFDVDDNSVSNSNASCNLPSDQSSNYVRYVCCSMSEILNLWHVQYLSFISLTKIGKNNG